MYPRIILHLDMNSYFASVEQQANPFLRGKAIGVVATMSPNGCVIASSTEAKKKGIKTGVRVKEARSLDPHVILIPNDSAKYRSCTEGIFRILREYTDDIEMYSIDEAFLNLTGFIRNYAQAMSLGQEIRRRIQAEVGTWLQCSMGIAPTRWLAKFAGDTAAKGATLLVDHDNLATTLDPRPLTDAWGIAHGLERRLQALNLYTLGDLRHYPVMNLMQVLGIMGYELWANVQGIEIPGLRTADVPKSIGHQHVFARKATSLLYPKAVLAKLCEKAGRRLRRLNFEAYGAWVWFSLSAQVAQRYGRSGGGGGGKLGAPLTDTRDIFQHCWQLLLEDLPRGALPNAVGMGLFWLKPRVNQLELWPQFTRHDPPSLAQALDTLNDKYGDFTVTRGSLWGLTDRDAPDRVGFRKTVVFDAQQQRYQW